MASDLEQLLRLGVISPDVFAKYLGHLTQAAQAQAPAGQQGTPPASAGPAAMAPGPTALPQGSQGPGPGSFPLLQLNDPRFQMTPQHMQQRRQMQDQYQQQTPIGNIGIRG